MQAPSYPISLDDRVRRYPLSVAMADSPHDPAYWARVVARMKERKLNQTQMAKVLRLPAQSAFSNLIKGRRALKAHEKAELDSYLGLDEESSVVQVPIIGLTNAGNWREAIEMPLGYTPELRGVVGRRAFAVEVRGDSMDLLIEDGGYVVIDPDRTTLYDGSIYLIANSDEETTLKRYHSNPARFCPMSSNPEHLDMMVGEMVFRVIGKAVTKGMILP